MSLATEFLTKSKKMVLSWFWPPPKPSHVGLQSLSSHELAEYWPRLKLPENVSLKILAAAWRVVETFTECEGRPTGCGIILGDASLKGIAAPLSMSPTETGLNIQDDPIQAFLRSEFAQDGFMLVMAALAKCY